MIHQSIPLAADAHGVQRKSEMHAELLRFLPKDRVAIDLGTSNTLIHVKGKGLLLDEPSLAILDSNTRKVVAVGEEAKQLTGRHGPELETYRPLVDGVITDFEVLTSMIRLFLEKVSKRFSLLRRSFVLAVPTGITPVEKRALKEAAKKAGAGKVYFVQEPVAAAIGTGLRIDQPVGRLVVDIGGGTTEAAVVCKFAVACCESLRVAGDELDDAIRKHVRQYHAVEISQVMAESIKIRMGSVFPLGKNPRVRFKAKDVFSGAPKEVSLTAEEIRHSMLKPVRDIMAAVARVLDKAPPNIAADIAQDGIWLAGGVAQLRGWRQLFYKESGLDVKISQDPLRATIRGISEASERFKFYRSVFYNGNLPRYN